MERSHPQPQPQGPTNNHPPIPVHDKTQTAKAALRDCAGLDVRDFVLAIQLRSGESKCYSSESLGPYLRHIVTDEFAQAFDNSIGEAYSDTPPGARSLKGDQHFDTNTSGSAKRRQLPTTPASTPTEMIQQLRIGDKAVVEKFYETRLQDMQQEACKMMGKEFVKLLGPKKQTLYPYTKGDNAAPPWWPDTTGENGVRHKEPDHLWKPERITLLIHLLRLVIQPGHRQHVSIRELCLSVKNAEDAIMKAMDHWFNDKDFPGNAGKKAHLKEIFKIAQAEERFENGEIDGSTYFALMKELEVESNKRPRYNNVAITASGADETLSSTSPDVHEPSTQTHYYSLPYQTWPPPTNAAYYPTSSQGLSPGLSPRPHHPTPVSQRPTPYGPPSHNEHETNWSNYSSPYYAGGMSNENSRYG